MAIMLFGVVAAIVLRVLPMKHAELRCIQPDAADHIQRITETHDIGPLYAQGHAIVPGQASKIFPYLVDVELMTNWMPGLKSGAYDGLAAWEGIQPGSIRQLNFGAQADVERILLMDAPFHFAYQIIGGIKIDQHLAFMTVHQSTPDKTTFSWLQFFEAQGLRGRIQKWQVRRFVRSSVSAFAKRFNGTVIEGCA